MDPYENLDVNKFASYKPENVSTTNTAKSNTGGGSAMPYGDIAQVALTALNSLPDWYQGMNGNSNEVNQAIYGDSTQDPLVRLLSGHNKQMSAARDSIDNQQMDYSQEDNNQNLYNVWNSSAIQNQASSNSGWQNLADFGTATAKGAAYGTMVLPGWGTLIGAAVGSLANIVSQIGQGKRRDRLNNTINMSYLNTNQSYQDQIQRNNQTQLRNNMRNYFAEGGSLNGVETFDVGGSHEQNPFGGIPQGQGYDGTPNLVEEGEVKFKDYIYSKRLAPSIDLLRQEHLPEKYKGKSYAEIAKTIQKDSEQRPNDPISKRTLVEMMDRLKNVQETQKQFMQQQAMSQFGKLAPQMMALGGNLFADGGPFTHYGRAWSSDSGTYYNDPSKILAKSQYYNPANLEFMTNGKYNSDYQNFINNLSDADYSTISALQGFPSYIKDKATYQKLSLDHKYENVHAFNNSLYRGYNDNAATVLPELAVPSPKAAKTIEDDIIFPGQVDNPLPVYEGEEEMMGDMDPSLLRYSPAIGSGIGAIAALATPADYEYAEAIENLAGSYRPIAAPSLGGYRRYNPFDVNYSNNQAVAQQAAALRRSSQNPNRSSRTANEIALIKAFEGSDTFRNLKAQQANETNRASVDAYNQNIDRSNLNLVQFYDQLNQQILRQRNSYLASGAAARDRATSLRSSNVSNSLTNFFNNMGALGKDKEARQMAALYMMANADNLTADSKDYYSNLLNDSPFGFVKTQTKKK